MCQVSDRCKSPIIASSSDEDEPLLQKEKQMYVNLTVILEHGVVIEPKKVITVRVSHVNLSEHTDEVSRIYADAGHCRINS